MQTTIVQHTVHPYGCLLRAELALGRCGRGATDSVSDTY